MIVAAQCVALAVAVVSFGFITSPEWAVLVAGVLVAGLLELRDR